MKSTQDERFGVVWQPENFIEICQLITGKMDQPIIPHMWRGQANKEWLIHSSAYRKVAVSGRKADEQTVRIYENHLLSRATHRGFRFYEGRELSDFELLARLQHHGASTRLVDTTRNAFVALYFACASHPDKSGMLFGLHAYHLGGGEGELLVGSYVDIVDQASKHTYPQTWEPPAISPRIAAQHSQFVYSSIDESGTHGSICIDRKDKSLFSIEIKPQHKISFLAILRSTFDITPLTIFPDLDGFGSAHSTELDIYSNFRW